MRSTSSSLPKSTCANNIRTILTEMSGESRGDGSHTNQIQNNIGLHVKAVDFFKRSYLFLHARSAHTRTHPHTRLHTDTHTQPHKRSLDILEWIKKLTKSSLCIIILWCQEVNFEHIIGQGVPSKLVTTISWGVYKLPSLAKWQLINNGEFSCVPGIKVKSQTRAPTAYNCITAGVGEMAGVNSNTDLIDRWLNESVYM